MTTTTPPSPSARRGAFAIMGGTAIGQVLALAAAPVLSRLFSPSDFGTFTVIVALSSVLATVSALRLELAVPLPQEDKDSYALVTLGLLGAGFILAMGLLGVGSSGQWLASKFEQPDLMPWLWAVPVTSATMAVYLLLNQLAVRQRRYTAIGRRNVLQSVVLVLTQVGTGAAGIRPGGLVLGLGLGQLIGAVSLLHGSGLTTEAAREGRSRAALKRTLHRYKRFPLVLAPSGLCNVLGVQLPVLLIAYYYGDEVAGWLGLSQRVLALPVTLIGTAASQVYLGQLLKIRGEGTPSMMALFKSATRRLALVAAIAVVVLLLTGPQLFAWVFGSEWLPSGEYARALSLGLAMQLIAAPLSQTLAAFEKVYLQLSWDIGRLVMVAGATALAAAMGGSALVAVYCFSTASAVAYCASWLFSRHTLSRGYSDSR